MFRLSDVSLKPILPACSECSYQKLTYQMFGVLNKFGLNSLFVSAWGEVKKWLSWVGEVGIEFLSSLRDVLKDDYRGLVGGV